MMYLYFLVTQEKPLVIVMHLTAINIFQADFIAYTGKCILSLLNVSPHKNVIFET